MIYTVPRTARTRNPYTHVSAHHMLRVGLLTDMRLGRRTDTRTHTRAHFSIYLLLRVRPRCRETRACCCRRPSAPAVLSSVLVAEREGVGAPADGRVLDPAAARHVRAVSGGRLVVGGLVCEGRGERVCVRRCRPVGHIVPAAFGSGSSAAA